MIFVRTPRCGDRLIRCGGGVRFRVLAGAGGRRDGFAARPEKPHRSAHDFIRGALLALFIVPLAGFGAAFSIDLVSLLSVLLREPPLLSPQDDPVAPGAVLA